MNHSVRLYSLVLITLIVTNSIISKADKALLQKACSKAKDQASCISSLESNPDSKTATTKQLGIIALTLAQKTSTDTANYIKEKLREPLMDPALQQELTDCMENYIDANVQLKDSIAGLLADDHLDVQARIDATTVDIQSCEDGLKETSSSDAALVEKNNKFLELLNTYNTINSLLDRVHVGSS